MSFGWKKCGAMITSLHKYTCSLPIFRSHKKRYALDLAIFLLLCLTFFGVYATYGIKIIKYEKNPNSWYQPDFAPSALNVFRGKSFIYYPHADNDSVVPEFIKSWKDSTSPHRALKKNSLPEGEKPWHNILNKYPGIPIYIGYWWRTTGVASWDYTVIALALWGAVTSALLYILFRFFSVRPIAFQGTLICGLWPQNIIMHMTAFRDSSRALFVIGMLVLLCWVFASGFRWRKILGIGLCLGVLTGFGLGFRTDFVIVIPFFLIAAIFHGGISKYIVKKVSMCCLAVQVVFLFVKVIYSNPYHTTHDNLPHVFYIGMSETYDRLQWEAQRDDYKWCIPYQDWYGVVTALAIGNYRDKLSHRSWEYNGQWSKIVGEEILRMARHFPYDFLARGEMTFENILNLTYESMGDREYSPFASSLPPFYKELHRIFSQRIILFIAAFLLLSFFSWEKGFMFFLVGLCLCGTYSLQNHIRHYFYLYFVAWVCLAIILNFCIRILWSIYKSPSKIWKRVFTLKRLKNVILAVGLIAACYLVLIGTFFYQERHVFNEMKKLHDKEKKSLDFVVEKYSKSDDYVIISAQDFNLDIVKARNPQIKDLFKDGPSYYCEFLSLEFNFDEKLKGETIPVFLNYAVPENAFEIRSTDLRFFGPFFPGDYFSTYFPFPIHSSGTYTYTFPVYFCAKNQFLGVVIPKKYQDCVTSLKYLSHPSDMFYHGYVWEEPERQMGSLSIYLPKRVLFPSNLLKRNIDSKSMNKITR